MFKPTTARSVEEYIDMIEEPRSSEIRILHEIIREITPHLEVALYNSVVGYGKYHYKSKSGREGDWFAIGLASQKNYISLYICSTDGKEYLAEKYKARLPKASIGKSCVRFKHLSDVDMSVIRELITKGAKFKGIDNA